jgi:ElaB/YqjD/DUF883 family membrane-anchored ribosome-binding protein
MGCQDYGEYITIMMQCPALQQNYTLTWNEKHNTLQSIFIGNISDKDCDTQLNCMQSYYSQMQKIYHHFKSTTYKVNQCSYTINTNIQYWEEYNEMMLTKNKDYIKKEATHLQEKVQGLYNQYHEWLQTEATAITEENNTQMNKSLQQLIDAKPDIFKETLDDMLHNACENIKTNIAEKLHSIQTSTEAALQLLSNAAKNVGSDNMSTAHTPTGIPPANQQPRRSTLFPNVDPDLYKPPPNRHNPYLQQPNDTNQ